KGRPGWHIECSAMSTYYLGETIDIHIGGVDLIFPHHENEIAQSEGATGKTFVRYWIHGEHLLVDRTKMSKSKGNFYTLKDLEEKGFDLKALRFLYLKAHYRTQMNFTIKSLEQAEETLENLFDFMVKLKSWKSNSPDNKKVITLIEDVKSKFEREMDDNLNTPGALAAIFLFVKEVNKLIDSREISTNDAKMIYDTMLQFDEVLGILKKETEELPEEAKKLIEERERLRKEKSFDRADRIRDKLKKEYNIALEDSPNGPRWKILKK
ncbi:MAG: class I tRNA ligase family protein, partial [Candidatus Aenigmarchaeota archaeon]|nr:class I tRNA ligase family protein [Candidatus Aenigmarchaeota archaeon]